MTKIGFRQFYSYSYEDFKKEIDGTVHPSRLHYYIMQRMRCYASLFNRDMRKILIDENILIQIPDFITYEFIENFDKENS